MEKKNCPIVETTGIRLPMGDGDDYLLVTDSADSIQMFPDPRLNYLRYWDSETGELKAVWLASKILALLHDEGIPITKRTTVTQTEVDAHKNFCLQSAELEFPDWEAYEAQAYEPSIDIDAAWEFYSKEWSDD